MNRIDNKILTTPIQKAGALIEASQASSALQTPTAATGESIGKAMSNFDLIKNQTAAQQQELVPVQQGSSFLGSAASFLTGSAIGVAIGDVAGTGDKSDAAEMKKDVGVDNLDQIKAALDGAVKDLQSQDKMGNFQIQGLMSDFNEADTLLSSAQKNKDDSVDWKRHKLE